jgi:hypothetical protein
MVFEIICLVGLIFVVVTLPGALRRRGGKANHVPPVINDVVSDRTHWQKDPAFSPLARDRQEVLELWEKCGNDSSFPPPIPPAKPHSYFGSEAGPAEMD